MAASFEEPAAAPLPPLTEPEPPSERVALVTGGTRGIGFGIASCLAREGYSLVLGYNSDAEAAASAAEQLTRLHPGVAVECVGGDISLPATWHALHSCLASRFGGHLTALVHNAGLLAGVTSQSEAAPEVRGEEDWEAAYVYYHQVYSIAFKRGLSLALQHCTGLRHVVAISAQGCNSTSAPMVVYEAPGQAKAGLEYLVRLHALKLAPQGITVNAIVPGCIRTDVWSKVVSSEEGRQRLIAGTPAQRWGRPEEVGELAAFLCSDKALFLTGCTIPVDGGLHLGSRR